MKKVFNLILPIIILTFVVFSFGGCTNNLVQNVKVKRYQDEIEKITSATIIIMGEYSKANTTVTDYDINQDKKIIKTYEDLINSKTIKKDVEEKYGSINNVELEAVEDTDIIKVIYVCDDHNDEECKQILQELLSRFSKNIKEIYNKDVHIVDEPEISSRSRK